MPKLIDRLAQWIIQDNAILLVGTNLRQEKNQPPAVRQIAEALAQRIDYQRPDRSLPAVARDFQVLKGRNELIQAIQEELDRLGSKPTPYHQLIADAVLPHTKVITTRFDQVLEQALDEFHKPYVRIVRDADVPSFDESKVTLIKMQGDISQPDSLVITDDDIDAFIGRLPTVSDVIRAFFATKTLIFLGYDLSSELFKRFFRQVTRNLSAFHRPAYAIVPQPLDKVEEMYWQEQNVELCPCDPIAFLEELAQAVKTLAQKPQPTEANPLEHLAQPPRPPRPYKALDSFTAADVAIFAGRTDESQRLTNRILAHRLTVLYGESGSGKTSLLQAGAGPRLADNRALLAVCAPAPGQSLKTLMRTSLTSTGQSAGLTWPDGSGLPDVIRQWQRTMAGPIALAVDQFEQFFLTYNSEEQQEAVGWLHELLTDRSLDVRLVLVLREDFLGRLQTLEDRLPGLLNVRFRLERLGREAARAAIEEPARLFGVSWEPALVETLLDDLYNSAGVAPPQLQIVCQHLYQRTVEQTNAPVDTDEVQITLKLFQELGGTQAILGDYVDRVVLGFPLDQQPMVKTLLGALVSSGGVKQRLALDDLARTVKVEPEETTTILDELTRQRLIQRYEVTLQKGDNSRLEYELTHDYLAARIARWLGDDFWAAQKAREIVRQALPDWQNRSRLLPLDDLRLVTAQQSRVHFSAAEIEMVYASAVGHDHGAADWQTFLSDPVRQSTLLQLIDHRETFARRQAARQLAAFSGQDVSLALAQAAVSDPDQTVRDAAARSVARPTSTNPQTIDREAVTQLIEAAVDSNTADAALEALVTARDVQPATEELLPPNLRGPIRRQVWRARWRRNWPTILTTTLRAMQGGFAGLGLGIGLFLGLYSLLAGGFEGLDIPWQTVVSAMSVGVPLAGLIGMLAAGSCRFVGVVLHSLEDRAQPWRRWLVATSISAVVLGLGFVLMANVFGTFGQAQPWRSLLAGMVIGLGLAGAATAPLKLATPLRLGMATATGVAAFVLAWALGLIFSHTFWWLLFMGVPGSAGFFWGLNPSLEVL